MKKLLLTSLAILSMFVANAQFVENFDSSTSLPAGWSILDEGSTSSWGISTAGPQSGTNHLRIDYASAAHDDYVITPSIAVSAGVNDRLSFYIKSYNGGYLESYDVRLSTTDNLSGASFTEVLQAESSAPAAWTQLEFDLSAYVGQTIYVALRATDTNQWRLYADSFVNDGIPSCGDASATMSAITLTGATATWAAATGAVSYDWEVVPTGSAQGVGVVASGSGETGLTASITGLTSSTAYDFLISSDCTTDYASAVTFTTLWDPYVGCGDTDYDTGGPNGNYSANEDYTITYTPDTPGDIVTIDIDYVQIEANWDFLSVYDGADINATQLTAAVTADVSYTASSGDGLTIRFTSDASGQYAGYSLTSSCAAPPSCDAITGFAVDSLQHQLQN